MYTVVVDRVKLSTGKQNFLKAQLAIDCTRTGLKDFVQDGINTLHQTILRKLSQRPSCISCTLTNVVKCPINGLCKGKPCQLHSNRPYRPCPNAFCDSFMQEITRSHRYPVPTWQNTDAKGWSTDPWQMAKCFCPTGYDKCTSADDTDLPGLIHIITSCTAIQAQITENLAVPGNTFHQVRDSRNAINHSASMEMTDAELSGHIDKMIDILEDTTFLQSHGPAIEAVGKLKKVGASVLSGHIDIVVDILEDTAYLQSHGAAIETVGKLKKLKTEPLLMTREEEKQMMKTAKEKYELDKKRLQSHLAEQYLLLYSKISLSPLVSEVVTDLDNVSVPQNLEQVKLPHETEHEAKQQQLQDVKSYRDIFTRNSQTCKNIYIKGEPGAGKTFLSQRIALSWSKVIKGETIEIDEEFIKQFPFLFYISLRYIRTTTHLDNMILDHPLLQCEQYSELITRILRDESETCLIVMDGLDEWSPSQATATLGISKGLPIRDVTRRCTILTTTRPWKLETIRMAPTEIDQLIKLTGIDEESSWIYILSLVSCLNEKFGRDMVDDDFIEVLDNNNVCTFMTLPVLLKYLVCLWHAGKPIGNSQCEIYSGLLDLLLQLPEKESECRNEALEMLKQTSPTENLPLCFGEKYNCRMFGSLLKRLSKLAFHTLFAENQKSSLVFDSSLAEIHRMSKTEIQICLNIGILSQDIVMEQCAVPEKSLSFLHKTFQEFLAAVYVYMFPDQTDSIYTTVSEYCSSVERVLEVSKVLVFMSGICPTMVSRLSEHVAGVVSGDEEVQLYRQGADAEYPLFCVIVQGLMAECIKEAHCAGLSQDLKIYIQDVTVNEYSPVTEHIQQLIQSSSGHIKSIYIRGSKYVDILQHVTQTGVLQRLAVNGDDDDYIPLSRLSGIIEKSWDSIKWLVLDRIMCSDLPLETLSQLFEGLSHLEGIELWSTNLSHEQSVWLMSYLSSQTGLRRIEISYPECTEHESESRSHRAGCHQSTMGVSTVSESGHIQLDLTSHAQLTALTLNDCHSGQIRLPTSCTQLTMLTLSGFLTEHILIPTSCSQLTTLELSWLHADRIQLPTDMTHLQSCTLSNIHTRGVTVSVLQALRNSSHLHKLDVWPSSNDEIPEVTDAVIDVLPTLHHIRHITLCELHIVGRQLMLSPLMTSLDWVRLRYVTLSRESLCCLVDSILDIPHPLKVELDTMIITPDEDTEPALDYIRSSARCVVTQDKIDVFGRTNLTFRT